MRIRTGMNRPLLLAGFATLLACFATAVARAEPAAAPPTTAPSADADASAVIEPIVPYLGGEWRIKATWAGGNALEAREVFEWGVGKKFISCKTFVSQPEGGEYQRYETIFGARDGKLTAWGFVFDGHTDVTEFHVNGKNLSSTKPMAEGGTLHQSIELVEPNKFHWVVSVEKDGKNQQVMDGYWIREASASR
jgi:hypothetical protein